MGTTSSSRKKKKTHAAAPGGEVTEVDRQVLGLKTQRRKLNAYGKRVEDAIAVETQAAKTLAKTPGKKLQALNALKRRKVQEQLATRIDSWLMQVEQLLGSIEEAQATTAGEPYATVVLQRLKQGNEALKAAQAGYTLDDVANILQEMDEAAEHQGEVSRLLADNLTSADDEAVEAELAALEAAETERAGDPRVDAAAKEKVDTAGEKKAEAAAIVPAAAANDIAQAAAAERQEKERAAAAVAAAMPAVPDAESPPEMPDVPLGSGVAAGAEDTSAEAKQETRRTLLPA